MLEVGAGFGCLVGNLAVRMSAYRMNSIEGKEGRVVRVLRKISRPKEEDAFVHNEGLIASNCKWMLL